MVGLLARAAALTVLVVWGLTAAKLPEWYTREVPDAEFQARLVQDAAEIERIAGDSFNGEVILIEVRIRPLYGSKISLRRADFLMRARNNNETSPAQTPDRIAGSAVLDLSAKTKHSAPDLFADNTSSPIWGGLPGTGTRPRRLGGPTDQIGGSNSSEEVVTAEQRSMDDSSGAARLQSIELPLELEDEPGAGYLYFEMPAKTKRKHLELSYDGSLGEFLIAFKKPE